MKNIKDLVIERLSQFEYDFIDRFFGIRLSLTRRRSIDLPAN
jgi:hypothetical protein